MKRHNGAHGYFQFFRSINEILEFSKKLEDAQSPGVKEIQDQLVKAAFKVAKNMNDLLENQQSVVINGDTIEITASTGPKLIENRQMPRLKNGSTSLPESGSADE